MKFIVNFLKYIKYLFYKFVYLMYQIPFKKVRILSDEETIEYIIEKKVSYSRFGDGEFNWILKNKQNSFQKDDENMANRMKEILLNPNDKVLVGLPLGIKNTRGFILYAKKFWTYTFVKNYKKLLKYIPPQKYGNASVTRPYMDYKNKKISKQKFENIKKLWQNKDVVIVEGEKTKIGVGNDLLNNANSVKRIICPARNAYDKYENIFNTINSKVTKDKLVLIALGPTATILAYDLGKIEYQAIDIGHIDIEYEWMKQGVKDRVAIKGKHVNECKDDRSENENIDDKEYQSSIIAQIL